MTTEFYKHILYSKVAYYHIMRRLFKYRDNDVTKEVEVMVKWLGCSKKENTRVPICDAIADFPVLLLKFIDKHDREIQVKLKAAAKLTEFAEAVIRNNDPTYFTKSMENSGS